MRRNGSSMLLHLCLPICLTALTACSKPQAPDHDDMPEPQASTPAAQPTQLREAMQQPIDKTRAAQAATDAAAERQREAIDAATGN